MAASTILLLESVASAGDTISSILTGAGYGVTITADPDVALDQGASHQLVMFDVTSGSRSGIDICREFRALPAAVGVPVMAVTTTDEVEERIAYLEAGADDVMARPFDARELEARVEALLLRFQRSRDLAPVISSDGVTMTKAKRSLESAAAEAVKENKGYRVVSVMPALKDGHPVADVTLVKGNEWKTASEKLD